MAYDALFSTVFARMDPEVAHEQAFRAIRLGGRLAAPLTSVPPAPRTVMGVEFPNAFGLAAGFDKNARAVPGLLGLGFGHVEVGTVTARPQPGNPRPRLFRLLEDEAIVNRMGFNNDGAAVVASRLHRLRRTRAGADAVIGVNIGKTKVVPAAEAVADYVESARLLAPYASYLVVNVSSPNTPGLRDLQAVDSLRPILEAVGDVTAREGVPLVVKIAPDLADADVDAVADLALELGLDGISATNTTIARPDSLRTPRATVDAAGAGGLSGPVLADRSTEVLRRLRGRVGDRLALVGVGGVTTPQDVRDRLDAGADLVQAYTGFVYGGPLWPARLARASRL
ncbi:MULTISPECIES: quinone-dependent dihydroorotate dehydrogenase [unclassified Aeromicrobium]|uniref:quinone-dependent dihydroorotate dehydrogenase n=1 Tax=unclassified Aeromicrobium TaxID=2633570 RepID=UPI0006FC1A50|nr:MULTISPECIES: quinone-dependent dihydroorotate dehydrogenase [unclassified Aeromicrobium]KQO36071.1 dihydroorotate dehydrogenase (quinone) [Aeromicrobium sp. Leaf245]KQP27558.1 dihydroorotate dehydrogenase (quinone) [Aeromicrobium sp. Leaf272]